MPITLPILEIANVFLALITAGVAWRISAKTRDSVNAFSWSLISLAGVILAIQYLLIVGREMGITELALDFEFFDFFAIMLLLAAGIKLNSTLNKLTKRSNGKQN